MPASCWIWPGLPDAGEGERLARFHGNGIGLLVSARAENVLPFEKPSIGTRQRRSPLQLSASFIGGPSGRA